MLDFSGLSNNHVELKVECALLKKQHGPLRYHEINLENDD